MVLSDPAFSSVSGLNNTLSLSSQRQSGRSCRFWLVCLLPCGWVSIFLSLPTGHLYIWVGLMSLGFVQVRHLGLLGSTCHLRCHVAATSGHLVFKKYVNQ